MKNKKFIQPSHVKELEKSKELQIYPVIKDKKGNIIDGFHRKAADPKWKEIVIDIKNPIEKVKIQLEANLKRREVTKEEKQEWIEEAKKELRKRGIYPSVKKVGEVLGVGHGTISKWLSIGNEGVSIETLDDRKLTPYGKNMFYLSEINNKESRNDAYYVIKEGELCPTLKRRSWFFHEDGREFSLREYARVQDFPDDFMFVGTKEKIKDQIGNAVSPKMAEYVAKQIPKSIAIELFAGCGGMSLGFEKVGHKIIWANDNNSMACRTYHANMAKTIIDMKNIEDIEVNEIKKAIGNQKIDLIFGGPPCQGFSMSGVRFKDDERNFLYKEFIRIVEGIKPKYFVMENVKGIMGVKDQIKEDFEKVGYKVDVQLIKGEDIGMKQKRHRVFFIGERK